jgi:ribosomal protection tetracycline resistance protein
VRTLNLGILAHVDAGKTSLTERLLFAAGVIDQIGCVDDGSTQTDTLALERQRGITIKAAVVSFPLDDVTVNLIDTPGHPDFIAEVDRALSVLDGAVLVISAVEGVQAQTRVLMRALRRLRIPTLIFVNKIDRSGAAYDSVLRGIAARLTPAIIAMGTVRGLGTPGASFQPSGAGDAGAADPGFGARLADLLAERDDALLAAYVADESAVSYPRLRAGLAAQSRQGLVHPVFFGSAITGAGISSLLAGLTGLLPAAAGDPGAPPAGTVFKVDRGPAGEKIAYIRMFSGTIRVRDRPPITPAQATPAQPGPAQATAAQASPAQASPAQPGPAQPGPSRASTKQASLKQAVTGVSVFERGSAVRRDAVTAGQIGQLRGLTDVRIGDVIGAARSSGGGQFPPPTLETVVVPARRADQGALHAALAQLAEQDPLINLRQDDTDGEIFVSLYGEVQKEVIAATLAEEFGIAVGFRETTVICIERPVGCGAAVDRIGAPENPFLATVGLRVEPAPPGAGLSFRLGIELGALPLSFLRAVEDTVPATLRQGLRGWQVTDAAVTLTHSGYYPRQSHAHAHFDKAMSSTGADFRGLTPLVLMSALRQAGTDVYEPVQRFRLEVPADLLGRVLPALARLRAVPEVPEIRGSASVIEGEIRTARMRALEQQLPGLTQGEGALECTFGHYQQVSGEPPARPRSDHNPLNRQEYLRHVTR